MKKNAEEAYNSILLEIADLAARVKKGTTEFCLPATETVRIAINGHYCFFAWVDGKMQLCKATPIPEWDKNSLWSQEDWNRRAMLEVFGIEFPDVKKPVGAEEKSDEDMPFGDDDEDNE